ncbi:POK9 protein, partial [Mystacornis crossleyi]|nr:POK9 protein [Mystacornis crossleyi]
RGSVSCDLAMGTRITISDRQVHVVPSTVSGPTGHGLSALLLGRSSTSKQGIFVLPGVTDADYTGIIKIMLCVLNPLITIPQGSKIAQLFPFQGLTLNKGQKERGNQGFGSSGPLLVAFTQAITDEKPTRSVTLRGPDDQTLPNKMMLLDSGADVTIIP